VKLIDYCKKNKLAVLIILIGIVLTVALLSRNYINNIALDGNAIPTISDVAILPGLDPLNTTYEIQGEYIKLIDGINEELIVGSNSKVVTKIWGEPVLADINGLSVENPVVILNQEAGGSGSFYFVAAAIKKDDGFVGSNAILLGDRVAIQNVEIDEDGIIVVNYADRPDGAAMLEEPSVVINKYFNFEDGRLVEILEPISTEK